MVPTNQQNRAACLVIALGLTCFLATTSNVAAQVKLQIGNAVPDAKDSADAAKEIFTPHVFLPPDRAMRRRLDTAKDLLKERRFEEALQYISALLESKEDFFFRPNKNAKTLRSLKSEARRLIGTLPPAGREAYERNYGPQAKRLLDLAITEGNVSSLAEISRRFPHTRAGYEALFLVGRHHLDTGRPLAASLCFQHVHEGFAAARFEPELTLLLALCQSRAGLRSEAIERINELIAADPNREIRIGDEVLPLRAARPRIELALAARDRQTGASTAHSSWLMFGGDAARSSRTLGDRPLLVTAIWQQRMIADPSYEAVAEELRQQLRNRGVAATAVGHPLAVDDTILARTPHGLVAFDFETGKRIWQIPSPAQASIESRLDKAKGAQRKQLRQMAVSHTVWRDRTAGLMSSDGRYVYLVENNDSQLGSPAMRWNINAFGRRVPQRPDQYNVLAAHEIRRTQGKRTWWIGGPKGSVPELERAFFLGPPLPLQGQLYVLVESQGEIRLEVLDPATGKRVWHQSLAVVEGASANALRRLSGLTPSFHEGVLVCPTGVGAVVGVDLTSRSLLWGYQYTNPLPDRFGGRGGFGRIVAPGRVGAMVATDRWQSPAPVIADRHVLLTPGDSNELHCLDLATGKLLWKVPRQKGLYVACVHHENVMIVGPSSVRGIGLGDGKQQWIHNLPEGQLVNGRGYYAGDDYYLPTADSRGGEVLVLDLASGKVTARSRSLQNHPPGNLICYRGQVISQNINSLQSFYQVKPLREQIAAREKNDAKDPWATTRRGELLAEQGKFQNAVPFFRAAYDQYSQLHTAAEDSRLRRGMRAGQIQSRDLLVNSLMEGLRVDFANNRKNSHEIRDLLDDPSEQTRFHRLMALGYEQVGEYRRALDAYLELIDSSSDIHQLQSLSSEHRVRLDRWLQTRLQSVAGQLANDDLTHFRDHLRTLHTQAVADNSTSGLRNLLRFVNQGDEADAIRTDLALRLKEGNHHLERSHLYAYNARHGSSPAQRAATAQLARLLHDADRLDDAAVHYQKLETQWANEICLRQKTGRQLVDALSESYRTEIRRQAPLPWRAGSVKIALGKGAVKRPISYQRVVSLNIMGDRGAYLREAQVFFDQQQNQTLIGVDKFGRRKWSVSLADPSGQRRAFFNQSLSYGRTFGHLLVLLVGNNIVAIDTLAAGLDGNREAILWQKDYATHVQGPTGVARPASGAVTMLNPPTEGYVAQFGSLAPATSSGIAYVRNRDVICLDLLTGDTIWTRNNVLPGSLLFGDEQHLFVAPPIQSAKREALVLDAATGTQVGRVTMPPGSECWATFGRYLLTAKTVRNLKTRLADFHVTLLDLFNAEGKTATVWKHKFAPGSKATITQDNRLAILEPAGRFRLMDAVSGNILMDHQLDEERVAQGEHDDKTAFDRGTKMSLKSIYLLPSEDRYLLVANRVAIRREAGLSISAAPGGYGNPLVNGHIYAFDKTSGDKIWTVPATINNYGLRLDQPQALPALAFARNVIDRRDRTSRDRHSSFLFLDKRTGRLLSEPRDYPAVRVSNWEIIGDVNAQKISIMLPGTSNSITLSFTDNPVPPGPPAQQGTWATSEADAGKKSAAREKAKTP